MVLSFAVIMRHVFSSLYCILPADENIRSTQVNDRGQVRYTSSPFSWGGPLARSSKGRKIFYSFIFLPVIFVSFFNPIRIARRRYACRVLTRECEPQARRGQVSIYNRFLEVVWTNLAAAKKIRLTWRVYLCSSQWAGWAPAGGIEVRCVHIHLFDVSV